MTFSTFESTFKGTISRDPSQSSQYIVYPTDAEDVSNAILFAKNNKLDLAIAAGRHSTCGASSSKGVVIDLSKHLNGVRVDAENRMAYVQGGAVFTDLEKEAIKYGLAACGGTVNDIGVAGLTLGGGFGWLTGEHGLALDNLISATIVVANGDILSASATENSDLFWGIRGGGSNFGVVVELVLQLHPQRRQVYTTSLTYTANLLPILVQQINKWTGKQAPNEGGSLTISTNADGEVVATFFGFKNADAQSGEAAFKPFVALGPIENKSGMVPYEELNTMQNRFISPGHKLHWGVHITRLDLKIFNKTLEGFKRIVNDCPAASASNVVFEFYHHDKFSSVPVDATAFAARNPAYNVLITTQWKDASFTPISKLCTQELATVIAEAASSDPASNLGYANYADGFAGVNKNDDNARLLFGSNYPRLQEIKERYDPDMVFNKWFAIRPSV
ncbi:hypothetical protein FRC03_002773 [Tulasnella sp. 419]|nr:hypothetical protein FRC03_002773 [Tulasnella sp. 419]